MRLRRSITGHRYHPHVFVLVGGVALILFILSFLVEVRIIVESPNYGDVTAIIATLWQAVLGLTTIGSFVLAVYNYRAETTESDGPATGFTIRGQNHDIDFHLHVADDESGGEDGDEDVESTEHDTAKNKKEADDSQNSS